MRTLVRWFRSVGLSLACAFVTACGSESSTTDEGAHGGSAGADGSAGAGSGGVGGAGTAGAATGGAGSGGSGGSSAGSGGSGAGPSTFPPVTDLNANGPFPTNQGALEGPDCTIFRPTTLGEEGRKHPVILWANGTSGPTTVYAAALKYWASYGFIVAAGNLITGQGSGQEILGCLSHVCSQGKLASGPYAGKVDCRAGATGHSQGGGGAIMAGQDPRVITTAPLMPYILLGLGGYDQASIGNQVGPMLLLSGTADTIAAPAQNQQPVFDKTNVPVLWANLVGGNHVTVALNGLATYRNVMLAWFRLQLMGDQSYRSMFYGPSCVLCTDSAWIVQSRGM